MKIVNGIYGTAKVFTTNGEHGIDDYALAQLQMICDNEVSKGCKIRVMPDVHPGKVGTIGLTMTVGERLMPNLVGIDIGCGMTLARIKQKKLEFQKLDTVIREAIPSGSATRKKPHRFADECDLSRLKCYRQIHEKKAMLSLGTLGGGNHFLEVDQDEDGQLAVIIHSGSRHLGKEVTEHYLDLGQQRLKEMGMEAPYELTYLEGELLRDYLHDLVIVQEFAALNREVMLDELVKGMKLKIVDSFSCIHNYVEVSAEHVILRKGAISAKKDEQVIIPINMRDGVLVGKGLGNEEWNCSAPHGAGRILRRDEVKNQYTLSMYKSQMKGIYSSCINKDTLDEAPFAYRSLEEIEEVLGETVRVTNHLRPIYNYKASN